MKWMKKTIVFTIGVLVAVHTVTVASAVTTGSWDLGKARQSIGNAATRILQQEAETEPAEYTGTEPAASGFDRSEWTKCWFQWMEGWR